MAARASSRAPIGLILGLVAALIAWSIYHYVMHDNPTPTTITDYAYTTLSESVKRQELKEEPKPSPKLEPTMVAVTSGARAAFRAVILGAPGSGKGTISARIVKQFNVTHISSGDKLRYHIAHQTALGKEVKKYLDSGSLVPDETMIALVNEEIEALKGRNWLLDGFPRTVSQAEALQKLQPVSLVINVDVPDSVILERIKNRWVHLPSGRVYNIGFNSPKVPGKDDVTGEALSQRPDDKPAIVGARLEEYAKKTKPVIDHYRKLGLLESFAGETTDSMWPDIRECVARFV